MQLQVKNIHSLKPSSVRKISSVEGFFWFSSAEKQWATAHLKPGCCQVFYYYQSKGGGLRKGRTIRGQRGSSVGGYRERPPSRGVLVKDLVWKLVTEVSTVGQDEAEGPFLIPNERGKFVRGWRAVEVGKDNNHWGAAPAKTGTLCWGRGMPLRRLARRVLSAALLCMGITLGLPRPKRSIRWSLRFEMMRTQTGVLSKSPA